MFGSIPHGSCGANLIGLGAGTKWPSLITTHLLQAVDDLSIAALHGGRQEVGVQVPANGVVLQRHRGGGARVHASGAHGDVRSSAVRLHPCCGSLRSARTEHRTGAGDVFDLQRFESQ